MHGVDLFTSDCAADEYLKDNKCTACPSELTCDGENAWKLFFTCSPGWTAVGNRCFKFDATARDYAKSVSYCISQSARIASIRSESENTVITNLIQAGVGVYIGAESDGKGNWKWNDGTAWWQPSKDSIHKYGIPGTQETRIVVNCPPPYCNNDRQWHDWGNGEAQFGVICAYDGTYICMYGSVCMCVSGSASR